MATEPQRYGTTVIELARDIAAAISPTTGTRGTGKVIMKSKPGKGTTFIPRNWFLYPVLNGAARDELVFKVAEGPFKAKFPNGKRKKASEDEPDAGSWFEVSEQGTEVDILSIVGGERHNLKRGTKFRLDPAHPDVEVECVLIDDIKDGAEPTWLGGCKSVVQFETLGGASATLDAFRSAAGKFPAVIIVWDGSEPADGTTQSSLERGATRAGPSQQLFKERFNLFVISQRSDSDHMRRNEGLKLLDDISFWLTDATEIDGQQFSVPSGVQIRARQRIAGDGNAYQQLYVYVLQVSVTALWRRYDVRTFNDWLLARNEVRTVEKDDDGNPLVVVNQDIDMTQS